MGPGGAEAERRRRPLESWKAEGEPQYFKGAFNPGSAKTFLLPSEDVSMREGRSQSYNGVKP